MNIRTIPTTKGTALKGIYATLTSRAITPEADVLVAALAARVCESRRNKGHEVKIHRAVEAFLADLLRAAVKGDGFAYRSLKKDTFTGEAVGHRTFSFLLKSFADLGWLEHITGKKYWRAIVLTPHCLPSQQVGRPVTSG